MAIEFREFAWVPFRLLSRFGDSKIVPSSSATLTITIGLLAAIVGGRENSKSLDFLYWPSANKSLCVEDFNKAESVGKRNGVAANR
jgi:hypothetical protein